MTYGHSTQAMSKSFADERGPPPAVRHQRIMEIASEQPDASMEEIASEIPSVTVDLVESVLKGCGDPAEKEFGTTSNNGDLTMSKEFAHAEIDGLTDKQYRTLEAIYEHPDATQEELAEMLDVSAPTISKRVNAVPGLEWGPRRQFVEKIFGEDAAPERNSGSDGSDGAETDVSSRGGNTGARTTSGAGDQYGALDDLRQRVIDLEARVDSPQRRIHSGLTIEDPDLIKKVVHASLKSDSISEDEELQILESIMRCE